MHHDIFIIYNSVTLSVHVLLYLKINCSYNLCMYIYPKYKIMCILIGNVFCFVFITIFTKNRQHSYDGF